MRNCPGLTPTQMVKGLPIARWQSSSLPRRADHAAQRQSHRRSMNRSRHACSSWVASCSLTPAPPPILRDDSMPASSRANRIAATVLSYRPSLDERADLPAPARNLLAFLRLKFRFDTTFLSPLFAGGQLTRKPSLGLSPSLPNRSRCFIRIEQPAKLGGTIFRPLLPVSFPLAFSIVMKGKDVPQRDLKTNEGRAAGVNLSRRWRRGKMVLPSYVWHRPLDSVQREHIWVRPTVRASVHGLRGG